MRLPNLTIVLLITGLSQLLNSCIKGPGFLKQDDSANSLAMRSSTDADGALTATLSAGSSVTQVLSSTDGSAVAFPPGSIGISTSIKLETGSSVASGGSAASLGVSGISTTGPAVMITSSTPVDATAPFSIQLPLGGVSALALTLADLDKLVIFYKTDSVTDGKRYLGFITRDNITVSGGYAKIETKNFGIFQAALTTTKVTEAKKVETTAPMMSASAEKKLSPVTFTMGTPTYSASNREVKFPVTMTGFSDLKACYVFVHEDKNGAWIKTDSKKDFKAGETTLNSEGYNYRPEKTAAHTVYARYSCEDTVGHNSQSDWSSAFNVPAGSSSSSSNNSVPQVGTVTAIAKSAITVSVSWPRPADFISNYKLSWKQGGTNDDCTTGDGFINVSDASAVVVGQIRPLVPNTLYAIAVCSYDSAKGVLAQASHASATTMVQDNSYCNASDMNAGNTCIISGSFTTIAAGSVISGPGSITISTGTLGMSNSDDELVIDIGGDLNVGAAGSIQANGAIRATNIDLTLSGAMISASNKGFSGGMSSGDGFGPYAGSFGTGSASSGGGGAHYGAGGDGAGVVAGGTYTYGNTDAPTTRGAGGGAALSNAGGKGGGSLKIEADGTLTLVSGWITANGMNGVSGSGGGAGGSIWIKANTITGAVTNPVSAGGGAGGSSGSGGGGGGGGYVKIESATNTTSGTLCVAPAGPAGTSGGAVGSVGYTTGC